MTSREVQALSGGEQITLRIPQEAQVFESQYPAPPSAAQQQVLAALEAPIGAQALSVALRSRRPGDVVVVVSDITRPIPYREFLPALLGVIEQAGVARGQILILIATGMHRPSTAQERVEMFGPSVVEQYRIADHQADQLQELVLLDGYSWSGAKPRLNRHFVNAGFRLITGLVEPHFMAGFSGGRKAVCPGLASLETLRQFHGYNFLNESSAANTILDGNPCHEEALSVARLAGVDFSLNVVLDHQRRVVGAFAGELDGAHRAACEFASKCACRPIRQPADVVVTSSGGAPLDATFYQCIKGVVSCLPAVRPGGTILAFGGCEEGIGSPEYTETMFRYADDWPQFLKVIQRPGYFVKDQWQFQMHCRALAKVGRDNLFFLSEGLDPVQLSRLSVRGVSVACGMLQRTVQERIDRLAALGKSFAVFPEGPYCVPVVPDETENDE